jgi:exopolysaccharide production protein ExoQ
MPPTLALVITVSFIAYLFRRDVRERPNVTGALWLPVVWVFIVCSKTPSQWLYLFGLPGFASTSIEEGSSLDALVLSGMILFGLHIVHKRQIRLSDIARENPWLVVFVLYCLLSAAWADSPLISGKRWIKMLGHPVMVLVILTEPEPGEALTRLMKRCAYVILPISILWMKYYPVLGRHWDIDGFAQNSGITADKNELGAVSIIFALFFLWHVLQVWKEKGMPGRRNELLLSIGLLFLTGYCLWKAHSATSALSLILAGIVMLGLGLEFVDKRRVRAYAVTFILLVIVAQGVFDVFGTIVAATGHTSTLEGRGRLWQVLLATDRNPILGAGYESYWSGERLQKIWSMSEFWWRPVQAHNGYIEVYLNVGIVGLMLMIGVLVVTFGKCYRDLLYEFEWGRLTMSYFWMMIVHNWTEAGFKGLSLMFFVFFFIAINMPRRIYVTPPTVQPFASEDESMLAYSNSE